MSLAQRFPRTPIIIGCEATPPVFAILLRHALASLMSPDLFMLHYGQQNLGEGVGITKTTKSSSNMEDTAQFFMNNSAIKIRKDLVVMTNKEPDHQIPEEVMVLDIFKKQLLKVEKDPQGKVSGDRNSLRDDLNDAFMLALLTDKLSRLQTFVIRRVADNQIVKFQGHGVNQLIPESELREIREDMQHFQGMARKRQHEDEYEMLLAKKHRLQKEVEDRQKQQSQNLPKPARYDPRQNYGLHALDDLALKALYDHRNPAAIPVY